MGQGTKFWASKKNLSNYIWIKGSLLIYCMYHVLTPKDRECLWALRTIFWCKFVQVLRNLKKRLVKDGVFSLWENNYQQIRTCLEIGYNCIDMDRYKRPTAVEIIHRLEETESPDYSGSSGPPTLWQVRQPDRMKRLYGVLFFMYLYVVDNL
jgi:hypothetical protein